MTFVYDISDIFGMIMIIIMLLLVAGYIGLCVLGIIQGKIQRWRFAMKRRRRMKHEHDTTHNRRDSERGSGKE